MSRTALLAKLQLRRFITGSAEIRVFDTVEQAQDYWARKPKIRNRYVVTSVPFLLTRFRKVPAIKPVMKNPAGKGGILAPVV